MLRAYSRQGEIEDYLFDFAKKFDLLRYITFDTRVTQIEWNENKQVIFCNLDRFVDGKKLFAVRLNGLAWERVI